MSKARATLTGRVKLVRPDRGYAFLHRISDGRADDIFAHKTRFVAPSDFTALQIGDVVEFVQSTTRDGRLEGARCRVLLTPDLPPLPSS